MRVAFALIYVGMMVVGWFQPVVAIAVFAMLGSVLITGRRRQWCGTYCPRGSFLDKAMAYISPRKTLPRWMTGPHVRHVSLAIFLAVLSLQVMTSGILNGFSWALFGTILYRMCLVSSAVALPLALVLHQRAWCTVCPVGNILRR